MRINMYGPHSMAISHKPHLLAEALERFVRQYARKAQRGIEPNDRRYSRKAEKVMRRLRPEDLSEILAEGEEAEIPG